MHYLLHVFFLANRFHANCFDSRGIKTIADNKLIPTDHCKR